MVQRVMKNDENISIVLTGNVEVNLYQLQD